VAWPINHRVFDNFKGFKQLLVCHAECRRYVVKLIILFVNLFLYFFLIECVIQALYD